MKRFAVPVLVLAALLAVAVVAQAGMVCDQAAYFEYKSPALNWHCFLEWLWEVTT